MNITLSVTASLNSKNPPPCNSPVDRELPETFERRTSAPLTAPPNDKKAASRIQQFCRRTNDPGDSAMGNDTSPANIERLVASNSNGRTPSGKDPVGKVGARTSTGP